MCMFVYFSVVFLSCFCYFLFFRFFFFFFLCLYRMSICLCTCMLCRIVSDIFLFIPSCWYFCVFLVHRARLLSVECVATTSFSVVSLPVIWYFFCSAYVVCVCVCMFMCVDYVCVYVYVLCICHSLCAATYIWRPAETPPWAHARKRQAQSKREEKTTKK